MDRAARQDDLAAAEFLFPAVDLRLDPDAARTLEQQLLDLRVGRDRQIGAPARVAIEIAHRCRDALLGLIGVRHREVAFDELAVLVGQERIAGELAGLGNGLRVPGPVLLRDASDRNAAILAVERPVEIEVALDLLEVGQHVLPAPARGAAGLPFVVVGRAPRLAIWPLIEDPPPNTRACSYLRSGGRSSSGLLWLTTWVVTLSSVQWKRGSKYALPE